MKSIRYFGIDDVSLLKFQPEFDHPEMTFLPGDQPRTELGRDLSLAVESVRARGRHAIIADFCDLAAVAGLEDVYASALLDSIAAPEDERPVLREAMTRLFESGLATGLVLSAAP